MSGPQGNDVAIAFADRRLTACLSMLIAAVTLLLFPIGALILGNGFGGGGEFDLAGIMYSAALTEVGAIIVSGAGILGFWSDRLYEERKMPAWLAWVILLVLAIVGMRYF